MVVVLVVVARTATLAMAAVAVFRGNGRAANMKSIVAEGVPAFPYNNDKRVTNWEATRLPNFFLRCGTVQPNAFTTASPICAVPTLVVPSL